MPLGDLVVRLDIVLQLLGVRLVLALLDQLLLLLLLLHLVQILLLLILLVCIEFTLCLRNLIIAVKCQLGVRAFHLDGEGRRQRWLALVLLMLACGHDWREGAMTVPQAYLATQWF